MGTDTRSITMPSESISELVAAVRHEAAESDFPIDEPVYRRASRDPKDPILFAGSMEAPVCFVGRDLGKDEVAAGQPLIGAAGKLVRVGVLASRGFSNPAEPQPAADSFLQDALKYVLLTNTVPYKPPGNKAYAESVRRRFRPFVERLLTQHWKGRHVITLGSEAFQWFEPYADPDEFAARGRTEARFESAFHCRLPRDQSAVKEITVYPLPHPSPLNRRWYDKFPQMLADRLAEVLQVLAVTPRPT
jgi:uracil-DNA glycosylase